MVLLSILGTGNKAKPQVVLCLPPEQQHNGYKTTTEGKEEQIAHAASLVQDIIAGPKFELGQGWNIKTT